MADDRPLLPSRSRYPGERDLPWLYPFYLNVFGSLSTGCVPKFLWPRGLNAFEESGRTLKTANISCLLLSGSIKDNEIAGDFSWIYCQCKRQTSKFVLWRYIKEAV
ncbi:hypothetical protein I7I50_00329 [Histoplasma capsulatum G186AR]|uniref:Uncharacterized protein n=1 Tax=Ajellomyces capsulatus TaxID=5037 RepID=A0A8H7YFI6_AJECA|nr:hypothetical protein I7I52_07597 [Histoplasma capsulatum]QSS72470.1 hypothetical protein I7I50_00329 [Histoplasma capsulatum G186AR]